MQMLNNVSGNKSSKRVMGCIYLSLGGAMAIADQFTKYKIDTFEVWVSIVVTGASLLGLSLFEYFGKMNNK
jgi:hypothetical protein